MSLGLAACSLGKASGVAVPHRGSLMGPDLIPMLAVL